MDSLYRLESASVKDIQEDITDAPSYSAVRTLIQKLVDKGHVSHREVGKKYVYFPLVNRRNASKSAMTRVVSTFFRGSTFQAMNSLLDMSSQNLSDEELDLLEKLISEKKDSGR